jgi:hypothetical protein
LLILFFSFASKVVSENPFKLKRLGVAEFQKISIRCKLQLQARKNKKKSVLFISFILGHFFKDLKNCFDANYEEVINQK